MGGKQNPTANLQDLLIYNLKGIAALKAAYRAGVKFEDGLWQIEKAMAIFSHSLSLETISK